MDRVEWLKSRQAGIRRRLAQRRPGSTGSYLFYVSDRGIRRLGRIREERSLRRPVHSRPGNRDFFDLHRGGFWGSANPPASLAVHRLKAMGYEEIPF